MITAMWATKIMTTTTMSRGITTITATKVATTTATTTTTIRTVNTKTMTRTTIPTTYYKFLVWDGLKRHGMLNSFY